MHLLYREVLKNKKNIDWSPTKEYLKAKATYIVNIN